MTDRRSFLKSILAAGFAPAIVSSSSLMVMVRRQIVTPQFWSYVTLMNGLAVYDRQLNEEESIQLARYFRSPHFHIGPFSSLEEAKSSCLYSAIYNDAQWYQEP